MTENIHLEPCPFCGDIAKPMEGIRHNYVMCENPYCEAMGASCNTISEAIQKWNRRPTTITERAS